MMKSEVEEGWEGEWKGEEDGDKKFQRVSGRAAANSRA